MWKRAVERRREGERESPPDLPPCNSLHLPHFTIVSPIPPWRVAEKWGGDSRHRLWSALTQIYNGTYCVHSPHRDVADSRPTDKSRTRAERHRDSTCVHMGWHKCIQTYKHVYMHTPTQNYTIANIPTLSLWLIIPLSYSCHHGIDPEKVNSTLCCPVCRVCVLVSFFDLLKTYSDNVIGPLVPLRTKPISSSQ